MTKQYIITVCKEVGELRLTSHIAKAKKVRVGVGVRVGVRVCTNVSLRFRVSFRVRVRP